MKIPDPFNLGLNQRRAIYLPYPQAVPLVYTIDKQFCRYFTEGQCRICEKLCPTKAVEFDQEDESFMLETGAIILAGGIEPFEASRKAEYGYGRWPNVITSLEYERMLTASGPFGGRIQRISDGRPPRTHGLDPMRGVQRPPYRARLLFFGMLHVGHQASLDHQRAGLPDRYRHFL